MATKIFTLLALFVMTATASAQSVMQIFRKGGSVSQAMVNEVDSIIFSNIILPPVSLDTIVDIDGNIYHTIAIGTQVWMVENLKTTKYRDGSPIPNLTDSAAWMSATMGAYCDYNNDSTYSNTWATIQLARGQRQSKHCPNRLACTHSR